MIKKMSLVAVAAIAMAGCNEGSKTYPVGEVYFEDGSFFGKTNIKNTPVFETGVYLFDEDNETVGFIDTDGVVYRNTFFDTQFCGGEFMGVCVGGKYDSDKILIGSCIVPIPYYLKEKEAVDGGRSIILPSMAPLYVPFPCSPNNFYRSPP